MPDKQDRDQGMSLSYGSVAVILSLLIIGAVGIYHLANLNDLRRIMDVEVSFLAAPDTVRAGVASRFVAHVALDEKEEPLSGRVVDVVVWPPDKGQIIAVSGKSGSKYAVLGNRAKGRTDSKGNLDITLTAEPGEYTLVALDSLSNLEESVRFHAVAPGG